MLPLMCGRAWNGLLECFVTFESEGQRWIDRNWND